MQQASHRLPGVVTTDHAFDVPLDHDQPQGRQISVFAREVVATGKPADELPWLLWFSGGPGNRAPRPDDRPPWLGRALRDFRVLLLDQRGTGRSTPATRRTLAGIGGPRAQADYLRHFRADAIVRDAEVIRRRMLGERQWSVLGQSFGGFCAVSYLSLAPDGLEAAYITGGLPPLEGGAEDVYGLSFQRTAEKNRAFFSRYPQDRERLTRLVDHLRSEDVRLPTGERLTPERFLTAGIKLGTHRGFDALHFLLEDAFPGGEVEPDDPFLHEVNEVVSFGRNPLYAVLHEPIYCQGRASRWAAQRVRDRLPEFDPGASEPLFTGEMVFPFQFEQDPSLVPLAETAELLAAADDWPVLYDADRLRRNEVPCAAAVYYDDMFVAREASLATADAIAGLRRWVTDEYEHDGVRESERVFDRLLGLVRGE